MGFEPTASCGSPASSASSSSRPLLGKGKGFMRKGVGVHEKWCRVQEKECRVEGVSVEVSHIYREISMDTIFETCFSSAKSDLVARSVQQCAPGVRWCASMPCAVEDAFEAGMKIWVGGWGLGSRSRFRVQGSGSRVYRVKGVGRRVYSRIMG